MPLIGEGVCVPLIGEEDVPLIDWGNGTPGSKMQAWPANTSNVASPSS